MAHARATKNPLRKLYFWTLHWADHKCAIPVLFFISFIESSFFPIPPDVLLMAICFSRPKRWFQAAMWCTIASVLGGLAGYAIGFFLFETIGARVIAFYGLERGFEAFRTAYGEWGLWIILIKGLTPVPFKIVTIASGAAQFDLTVFVLASLVTRGARFYLVAALIHRFGAPIRGFVALRYLVAR